MYFLKIELLWATHLLRTPNYAGGENSHVNDYASINSQFLWFKKHSV